MTFEEWWDKRFNIVSEYSFERPEIAILTWHDATQAERERCAKIADLHHIGHGGSHYMAAIEIRDAILEGA